MDTPTSRDARQADTSPADNGPAMTGAEVEARTEDFTRWRARHRQIHPRRHVASPHHQPNGGHVN